MKNPHHIALRPQYHWTDQKVRVHVFTCVVALMLLSLVRRELHRKGIDLSSRRIIESLSEIREMTMFFPSEKRKGKPIMKTSLITMTNEQKQIYQALDPERYASQVIPKMDTFSLRNNCLQNERGKLGPAPDTPRCC